ncbi:MAG TPA: transaldolase family protein [Ktedonobacterales bacterium]|nr:transaldolase family protein [Ktedonobacterales bacterium]
MGLYVDCALIEEVSRLCATFPIAGVTTNPSILLEAVERGQRLRDEDALRGLIQSCDGPVFAQPVADTADGLRAEGERYLGLDPARIVLKLPMTADGLAAGRTLIASGARVAFTAVASLAQAYLAAAAGADWVIPYFSRLRHAGVDACERIGGMARLLTKQDSGARLLVASVKSSTDVVEAAALGARDITARPEIIRGLLDDPLTIEAVTRFNADWRRVAEALGG